MPQIFQVVAITDDSTANYHLVIFQFYRVLQN